ncbi:hypothetical protein CRE_08662 [Caenorhabditis remanei]|uniref:Uncharacterized protein n=1 Tax=Caenorhabditis remanei TaxID=31234 RepID=E3LJ86_CAERE|nr:hypothetical protein CRE_08662 [Caenorhabditis remanei]
MADARATTCYLNGLSLRTINEVEKILRSLPREGDPCEIQCSQPSTGGSVGRSTADVIVSKSLKIHEDPKPLVLSPPTKQEIPKKSKGKQTISEYSCVSLKSEEMKKMEVIASSVSGTGSKIQCKVLTDQIQVNPIMSCNGVVLSLDVEVTIPDRQEKKKMKLEIECPDFMPARIKIGNKWKTIV